MTVTLTPQEASYLRYGLNAVKLGKADKDTTSPEDYAYYTRLHRRLMKKLGEPQIVAARQAKQQSEAA